MAKKKLDEVNNALLEDGQEAQETFEVESMEDVSLEDTQKAPKMYDPRWTEYALSFLSESEQYNGNPKADGLRRLVELLIGPIVAQDTLLLHFPMHGETEHHKNGATARSQIRVQSRETGDYIVASAVADASGVSCVHPYNKFLSSIAETRAEGRVYKKILRLQNVVTSDELPQGVDSHSGPDYINSNQIDAIDSICKKVDLNIIKGVEKMVGNKIRGIKSLTKDQAIQFLEICHKVLNRELKVSEETAGYDPDWRNYFG